MRGQPSGGVSGRPDDDDVAAVLERLAALIGAGVGPSQAWGHVAAVASHSTAASVGSASRGSTAGDATSRGSVATDGSSRGPASRGSTPSGASSRGPTSYGAGRTAEVVRRVAEAVARGVPVPRALKECAAGRAWRVVGAGWTVATEVGAPLAPFLSTLAASLGASARTQREMAASLAGPVATTRLVTALPVVAAVGGAAAGLGTLAALTTPAGLTCVGVAVALLVLAARWSRGLVNRARSAYTEAGLALDLIAIGLSGGGSTTRARRLARDACAEFELEYADASALALLELARVSGAPPGDLLRHEAQRIRADASSAAARRAAALGTWLMLPLGLCTLPAFLLLAVAPVLLALIAP